MKSIASLILVLVFLTGMFAIQGCGRNMQRTNYRSFGDRNVTVSRYKRPKRYKPRKKVVRSRMFNRAAQ